MEEVLLDVTRLVWRTWRGRHPTGIDRVCLAYVAHFRRQAFAVIQRRGLATILSRAQSEKLFTLLLREHGASRAKLFVTLARAVISARLRPPRPGMLYLNLGHTGLNDVSLSGWISRNRLKAIFLVHDLIPLTDPQFCRPGEAERHERRMKTALASAAGIVGNSKSTLAELERFAKTQGLGMPSNIAALISGYENGVTVRPANLAKPYFVVVGTIEARKNHLILFKVWRRLLAHLGDNAPLLVIVGQRGWEAEEAISILDDPGELGNVLLEVSDCSDVRLAELIAGARALLMPSFAEGFGLPITEALTLGTPVIASNLQVFREIAGDIPTYLDPRDVDGWEEAIMEFRGEGPARMRQVSRIRDYAAPTWAEHFKLLNSWLRNFQPSVTEHSGTA